MLWETLKAAQGNEHDVRKLTLPKRAPNDGELDAEKKDIQEG